MACSKTLTQQYNCIAILHIPNNHILTMPTDYHPTGSLKNQLIHSIAWKLGGIRKTKNNKTINTPPYTNAENLLIKNSTND